MCPLLRGTAVALVIVCGTVSAEQLPVISLEGQLVDVHCFALARHAKANGRQPTPCQRGDPTHPVGLLSKGTSDTVMVLATPPGALAEHMGRMARVEGEKSPLGEIVKPKRLQVHSDDGWSEVPLLPDM